MDDLPDFIRTKIIKKGKKDLRRIDEDDINIMFGIIFGIVITTILMIIIKYGQ